MSKRFLGFVLAALALVGVSSSGARAEDMDLVLSRLSRSGFTRTEGGRTLTGCDLAQPGPNLQLRQLPGRGGAQALVPDNTRWRQLVTQLAPAVAPGVLAPVTTRGPAGFDIAFETNVTGITKNGNYWEKGSRGHGALAVPTCDGENRFVQPTLVSNRLHFSKGLPLGITLGGTLGKLYDTSLWILGLDVKLALLEGMRGLALPDVAVRAAANTVVGDSQYSLTTLAADAIMSKSFVPGRTMTLSPYLGAGLLWTYATTEIVDLTPNIDATKCAAGADPACPGKGSQDDVGHDVPFKDVSFLRYRGFLGMQMRYKVFALAAEFMFDLANPHDVDKHAGRDTPRQWSVNAAPSLSF